MTSGASPACSDPNNDPEWWVLEHPGRCHRFCPHGLAAHICLNHCPLLKQCQDMAAENPSMWTGMVVGGMMWNNRRSQRRWQAPPMRIRCEACPQVEYAYAS